MVKHIICCIVIGFIIGFMLPVEPVEQDPYQVVYLTNPYPYKP